MTPKRPNEAGETSCLVRWIVETPAGWLGAYDREAFDAFRAGWQPIETAPRDGRWVIVYRPKSDGSYIPSVGPDYWMTEKRLQCWGKSRTDTPPTHWMPLPPPPSDL
jgi:hypothetical protein